MTTALVSLIAVVLDIWLGEPRRFHPLAGFGQLATRLEQLLYGPTNADRVIRGGVALSLAVLPVVVLVWIGSTLPGIGFFVEVMALYLTLGLTSLAQHGQAVAVALQHGDLPLAQQRVGWMVSRDSQSLDEGGVIKATIESVLENGNDAIFGALFWFLILGAPGAVLYRLVNTLDAMWGYRTDRYREFGWAVARLDDLLNWLPARLTALAYTLLGDSRYAWSCWRSQGELTESPNAGVVMAAGAGALGVNLGGPAIYHGQTRERPALGTGRIPALADINRALQLVRHSLWLWMGVILTGGIILALA